MDVWVMNTDGTGQVNLSDHPSLDGWARWSPDGSRIAFASNRDSGPERTDIYVMNADGSGVTRLTESPRTDLAPRWSPDGKWITFTRVADASEHVYIMKSDGSDLKYLAEGQGGDWSTCQSPADNMPSSPVAAASEAPAAAFVSSFAWMRQFGSDGDDYASGVAVDARGNLYVSGWVEGALPGQSFARRRL